MWKHKTSFSKVSHGWVCFFFFLFPLAEESFQNTWWEKLIVLGVKAPARPWEDLIWFPAPNEAENRPEPCVCDLPLAHPAAEQTEMEFCRTNSWLCTAKTCDVAPSSSSLADPTPTERYYWAKYRRKCFQQLLLIHAQKRKAAKLDFFHICEEERITCWVFSHVCAYSLVPHKKKRAFLPITPICVNTDVLLNVIQSVTQLHFLIITVLQFSLSSWVICHCPYPINHNSLHN